MRRGLPSMEGGRRANRNRATLVKQHVRVYVFNACIYLNLDTHLQVGKARHEGACVDQSRVSSLDHAHIRIEICMY